MTQSHQPRSARGPPLLPAYLVTLHPLAYPHSLSFRADYSIKLLSSPPVLTYKEGEGSRLLLIFLVTLRVSRSFASSSIFIEISS